MTFRKIRLDFVFDFVKLGTTHFSHMEYIEHYRISFFFCVNLCDSWTACKPPPPLSRGCWWISSADWVAIGWISLHTHTLCTWHLTWHDALTLPDLQQTAREIETEKVWVRKGVFYCARNLIATKYTLRHDVLWSSLTPSTGRSNQSATSPSPSPAKWLLKHYDSRERRTRTRSSKECGIKMYSVFHFDVMYAQWEYLKSRAMLLLSLSHSLSLAVSFAAEMIYMKAKSQLPAASGTSYYRIESVSDNCLSPVDKHENCTTCVYPAKGQSSN